MGYSYNADQAHQKWVEWAKEKSLDRMAEIAMTSGNPAFQQGYGTALSNTIEGRFGKGAALASGLINAGSQGISQQNFENSLKLKNANLQSQQLDLLGKRSESEITKDTALAGKYNAESEQANHITQFFKEHPDILKSYYDFTKKKSQKPGEGTDPAMPNEMVPGHVPSAQNKMIPSHVPFAPANPMQPAIPRSPYDIYDNFGTVKPFEFYP